MSSTSTLNMLDHIQWSMLNRFLQP